MYGPLGYSPVIGGKTEEVKVVAKNLFQTYDVRSVCTSPSPLFEKIGEPFLTAVTGGYKL